MTREQRSAYGEILAAQESTRLVLTRARSSMYDLVLSEEVQASLAEALECLRHASRAMENGR